MTAKSILHSLTVCVGLSALMLSACGSPPTALPTARPQPTVTERAVPTAMSTPTPTPIPTDTPTPVPVRPTASLAPTSCTTPVSVLKDKGKVSYNGMSFSYDPALAISLTAQDCPFVPFQEGLAPGEAHLAYTLFTDSSYNKRGTSLMPEIKVVAINQKTVESPSLNGFFYPPLETLGDLQKMLTTQLQPSPWFDSVALHARPHYLHFQNGTGVRAVVEYQMDPTFFNNNALLYAFDGLTRDGRYYVGVRFPIEAPFLIDLEGPDPRTNVNPRAIPIPNYDENEQSQAIEAYNQEALRRFNQIRDSDFTPNLKALDALVASLLIEPAR